MKRLITIVVAMASLLAATAQKSTLNGTLTGAAEGVGVVVCEPQGGHLVPTDTLVVDAKGHFKMKHEGDEPYFVALMLTVKQSPMLHLMMMPREKISLTLGYDATSNTVKISDVSGSENMRLYARFNNLLADASNDARLQAAMATEVEEMLGSSSELLMSAFLVTYFENAFDRYAYLYKQIRDNLVGKYPNDGFVKHLDEKLRTAVVAGMEAPDIALPDRDGTVRRLSDLRGKVVLVDFWASWCRPCRMENPNVVAMYKRHHAKGLEIYSVSLDNSREKWLQAISDDGLEWENHVSDLRGWSSAGGRLYGINSIPATVLIDREGKVVARNLRGAELEAKIKEILSE